MLDPYAAIATSVHLPAGVNVPPPKKGLQATATNGAQPPAYLGCLAFLQDTFDWQGSKPPRTTLEDTFILEVDIPSFLGVPSASIPSDQKGKCFTETRDFKPNLPQ